jgi:hypothetical protein
VNRCYEIYVAYPEIVMHTYVSSYFVLSYFLPAIALLVIYSLISKKIWSRFRTESGKLDESPPERTLVTRQSTSKFESSPVTVEKQRRITLTAEPAPTSRVSEANLSSYKAYAHRAKFRMLMMTAVIVALFVILNAPFACSMIWFLNIDQDSTVPQRRFLVSKLTVSQ